MFPNFRLLIAAVCASIAVLSFGFGLFAALRVSHEPLGRVSAGTEALQLVADRAAPVVAALAAGEVSGVRVETIPPQAVDVTASLPETRPEQHDDLDQSMTVAAAAPEPDAAVAPEQAVPVLSVPDALPDETPDAADSRPVSLVISSPKSPPDAKPEGTADTEPPAVPTDTAAVETPADQAPRSDPQRQSGDEKPASLQPAVEAMQDSGPDVSITETAAPLIEEVPLPPKRPARKVASPRPRAAFRARRVAKARAAPAANFAFENANAWNGVTVQSFNNWPLNAQTAQAAPRPAPQRVRLAKHRPAANSAMGGPLVRPSAQ